MERTGLYITRFGKFGGVFTTFIPKSRIASFDVDSQWTFTPMCPKELPVPDGQNIVPELNKQSGYAGFRVGSKDAHPPNPYNLASPEHPQFSPVNQEIYKELDIYWDSHGQIGTPGFELIDGLPRSGEYSFFVWKGMERDMHPYGACYHDLNERMSTGVIEYLKLNKVQVIIVGGLATDYCVKTTVLQLLRAGFIVILNKAACRGIKPETTDSAIKEMSDAGAIIIESGDDLEKMSKAA